jgi:small subunit ribosomal protein S36
MDEVGASDAGDGDGAAGGNGGDPSSARRRPLGRARGLGPAAFRFAPPVAWTIMALYLGTLLVYSVLMPTFRAPDEPLHADLAHRVAEDRTYPAWDEADTSPGIMRALGLTHFHIPRSSAHLLAEEAPSRGERPALEDIDAPADAVGINQLSQHPPLYYVAAGGTEWAVELVAGDLPFDREVWVYRLVSIAFVAPLPLVIWRIGKHLGLPSPVTLAAMLMPLAVPQLTHIGSAVNNDSLLLLAFWASTPVIVRLGRGDLATRTALLAGFLTGVGAFTKLMALALPVWVAAALLLTLRRDGRERLGEVVRAGAIYGAAAFVVGGWWWLRNLILYRELAPSRFSQILPPMADFEVDPGEFVQRWAYATTRRFWGDFGLFDTHIPAIAFGTATFIVLAGIAACLLRRDRVADTPIGDRLLLAGPLVLLVGGQFANAFRAYQTSGHFPGLQGRYWFGALAATAVVVALGLANLAGPVLRRLPLLMLAFAGAMQLVGIRTIVYHYWGAASTPFSERLDAITAWSTFPTPVLAAGAIAVALIALATATQLALLPHPSPSDAPSPPSDPGSPAPTPAPA